MLIWNGRQYNTLEQLQNDADFVALPQETQNYLVSVFQGNIPAPEHQPPRIVTPRQFRTALVLKGFSLEAINNFIDNLPSPQKEIAKIAWEYSTEFQRENQLLNQFAVAYGVTQQQLDEIFELASTL